MGRLGGADKDSFDLIKHNLHWRIRPEILDSQFPVLVYVSGSVAELVEK